MKARPADSSAGGVTLDVWHEGKALPPEKNRAPPKRLRVFGEAGRPALHLRPRVPRGRTGLRQTAVKRALDALRAFQAGGSDIYWTSIALPFGDPLPVSGCPAFSRRRGENAT